MFFVSTNIAKKGTAGRHNFFLINVAHGNAIPSENDVYRQTFLFVSSQPLITQKYH